MRGRTTHGRTGGGRGRVVTFDGQVGLGEVERKDGSSLPFHCVSLVDGTRTIEIGTEVRFRVRAALAGRWEATDIEAL